MTKQVPGYLSKEGFKRARKITAQYAKTFYAASLFLDREKRYAAYSIYAICRLSDNAVDDPHKNTTAHNMIKQIQQNLDIAYSSADVPDPLLHAFRKTITKYSVPKHYFDQLLQGVSQDLVKSEYSDFKELYEYCYRVAGVVGLMMLKIFDTDNKEAREYAVDMGIAMQLTNILRDIKEDFYRGRNYLPLDEMKQFKIDKNYISREFMEFQIKRAREFYGKAEKGIKLIQDKRCAFVASIMKDMYSAILDEIEHNDFNVFKKRAVVPLNRKLIIIMKRLAGLK